MKYAVAAAAFAAIASAQSLADVPKCAIPCLDKSIKANTDCEVSDLKCVCDSFAKVQGDATSCVLEECGTETALNEVLPAAKALCQGDSSESDGSEEEASSSAAAPSSSEAEAPAETTMEVTSTSEVAVVETTTMEMSTSVTPPAEPMPTPSSGGDGEDVPEAGAAAVGSIGAFAAVFLAALAL